MKPLLAIDSLHKIYPGLPVMEITYAGRQIQRAREDEYDLRAIRAPFNVMIVGAALEPLGKSLSIDPFPLIGEAIGRVTEIGFLVANLKRIEAQAFFILQNRSFARCEPIAIIDDAGEIAPDPPQTIRDTFDLLVGRWFRCVVDCFALLERSPGMTLDAVPLDLSGIKRWSRERKKFPLSYLQLR